MGYRLFQLAPGRWDNCNRGFWKSPLFELNQMLDGMDMIDVWNMCWRVDNLWVSVLVGCKRVFFRFLFFFLGFPFMMAMSLES